MPDPTNSGKVTMVRSDPNAAEIQPPGEPPPAPIVYVDLTSDQLVVFAAAFAKDGDVEVSGVPPSCSGVKAS